MTFFERGRTRYCQENEPGATSQLTPAALRANPGRSTMARRSAVTVRFATTCTRGSRNGDEEHSSVGTLPVACGRHTRGSGRHSPISCVQGPDDVHIIGRNASHTAPAKVLVVLVKDKGAPILTPVK